MWGGFLAGWPGLPGNEHHATYKARLLFGVQIFLKFPPKVALTFVSYLVPYTLDYGPQILRSIFLPVFELGPGAPVDVGLAARRERASSGVPMRASGGRPRSCVLAFFSVSFESTTAHCR